MIMLSVIIPTRNRASRVAVLLDSLAHLAPVSWEWEVLVVDNGSTDDTAERVKQKQAELPIDIRYVLESRPGLHEGRNRGALEARGKYLAYLDDYMVLAPTWLQGVDMLEEGEADAVVGRILPKWEAPPPAWLLQMFASGVFGPLALLDLGNKSVETGHFFGCNLFIPRKTVLDCGGFHPDGMPEERLAYRGDGETGLWLKMRADGKRLRYSPSAIAYHCIPASRMTPEYMRQRAYNQGISQSFTDKRTRHHLYGPTACGARVWLSALKFWMNRRTFTVSLRARIRTAGTSDPVTREVARIQCAMTKAFLRGMQDHTTAYRLDKALYAHVLRPSYVENREDSLR